MARKVLLFQKMQKLAQWPECIPEDTNTLGTSNYNETLWWDFSFGHSPPLEFKT